ncbi:biotin/lipoyl-containing protein [Paracoccus sp. (in: a-proteobacteria)]|uniref:biotin/lipoyl-containing protein n=1 Tax=Paracoccus sp. TaxID=267 RepID=UPI002AFEC815|nr:biotin/lipoyl-containing protein [Paracoccus sp. (in: a-proteobacteria)]
MGIHAIRMPDIGEGIAEAEIAEWLVKPGDTLREDDPMVAVMTDKATVEIPTPGHRHRGLAGRSAGRRDRRRG